MGHRWGGSNQSHDGDRGPERTERTATPGSCWLKGWDRHGCYCLLLLVLVILLLFNLFQFGDPLLCLQEFFGSLSLLPAGALLCCRSPIEENTQQLVRAAVRNYCSKFPRSVAFVMWMCDTSRPAKRGQRRALRKSLPALSVSTRCDFERECVKPCQTFEHPYGE